MTIRPYKETDWNAIARIHDSARKIELNLAGLDEAFLPLEIAAGREDLFDYPGLYVAETDGIVAGFTACTENVPARKLYENLGFTITGTESGKMPGNEAFSVEVYCMER